MQPPNDIRNFVHKRIFGAIAGGLTGGPGGAVGGFFGGGGGGRSGGQPVSPRRQSSFVNPNRLTKAERRLLAPGAIGALASGPCKGGMVMGKNGCVAVSSPRGAAEAGGQAVMGQYGAALIPMSENRLVRECLPGMVLGNDGLCYNRRDISNKEREYPRGTRPLGTPGEMAALRKAASFGRRMETTVKRMQKIGVLKKPSRGRTPAFRSRAGQARLANPETRIINVE